MRLILLDYKEDDLFGKKVCSESASFFKKHRESYKRMIVEQGRDFWIYLSISFKAYCLKHRILELSGISSDMTFTKMVEEVLEVTDQMLTNGHVKDGMKLCEDLITVHQYRSFIDEIQSQSVMRNPFYMWDSERTFCRLFGQPMEDKTMHLIKVVKTLQYLLHLGGCLFEMLRRWLHAEQCKQDVTIYWKPPPVKLFHVFGKRSTTQIKAYTVINKYERCLLDKTMYEVNEDTIDGRNLVDFKIDYNSEGSDADDPNMQPCESNSLVISILNEDTKEVTKRVKLKYPRWQVSTYSRNPGECPGCEDHLECIRKQVLDEGYVLPRVFEVSYEPYFHVKMSKQQTNANDCDGTLNPVTESGPSVASVKRKDKGLTRRALKQIAKQERRLQRKKKSGDKSLDKLEAEGLQKFVDACRKVPGFIEELERMQPKKIVGVPLPEGYLPELPRPAPGSECRVRILDPLGNEMDIMDRNAILEEEINKRLLKKQQIIANKMKNSIDEGATGSKEEDNNDQDENDERKDKESKDKEEGNVGDSESVITNVGKASKAEEKQSVPEMKQNEHSNTEMEKKKDIPDSEMKQSGQVLEEGLHQNDQPQHADQNEEVPAAEITQMEQVPDPEVKQKEQVPAITDKTARCLSPEDERTAINRLGDHQGEGSKDATGTDAIEMSDEITEMEQISDLELKQKEQVPAITVQTARCLSPEDERTAVNRLGDHQGEGSKDATGTDAIEMSDEVTEMEQVPDPEVKQKEQVPAITDKTARCLSPEDERTTVNRLGDHLGEGSKDATGTDAIEMSDEVTEIHKLRQCARCGKQEDKPKTYKKCQQCRQEKIKQAKFYCSRDCQVQDWKRRHWKEHLQKDREVKKTPRIFNNNEPLVAVDEGHLIIGLSKVTVLDDVD